MNQLKKKEYKNNNNIYLKIRIYQTNERQGKKKEMEGVFQYITL
jgi:hypothetical protein